MRASAFRELFVLHTTVARNLNAALAERPRPATDDRTLLAGREPIRVLLVGAGLAVGYGVTDLARALDGTLARALQAGSGHGVTIARRVAANMPIGQTVEALGAVGAHTYQLVVWCPTFTDLPRTWRMDRWLVQLRKVMRHLIETGDPQTHYLLLGYPVVEDVGANARVGPWIERVNARIARVAGEFPRTAFSAPPAVSRIGRALDADYYELCADSIAPAALRLLGVRLIDSRP